jgi:hypothetical protein
MMEQVLTTDGPHKGKVVTFEGRPEARVTAKLEGVADYLAVYNFFGHWFCDKHERDVHWIRTTIVVTDAESAEAAYQAGASKVWGAQ